MKVLNWFSCGAASAVAAKLSAGDVVYCDTGSEHPDNMRFLKDIESWLGQKITIMKNEKYKNIWDVFEKTKYLVGVNGARCTIELKKSIRHKIEANYDIQIFGYTVEEKNRAERLLEQNPEIKAKFPLIDNQLTKQDCLGLLAEAGIEIPTMYKLGYRNNNCIGCVKGGVGYWNKIRMDFPKVFWRMAKVERKLNVAINKKYIDKKRIRIFLDELPTNMGNYKTELDISCGVMCQIATNNFNKQNME